MQLSRIPNAIFRSPFFYSLLVLLGGCQVGDQTSPERPNIILILADDLGYGDLSYTGQEKFKTPNIDALAKDGVFFTQHYAGSTVCAPSRSALLTGFHTGHTQIRGNREIQPEGQYPLDSGTVTMASRLKAAGYVTGAFGKWGLGFPASSGDPNNQGFDIFYGYNCQRMGHNYYPYHLWDNQQEVMLDGNAGLKESTYAPELIHDKALTFLEENKDRSFFMYYPSIIPHAELAAPEENMEKYRGKLLPEKSFDGVDEGKCYKRGCYGSQPETHAAFAGMIDFLDQQVGEIREKLEELGIAKNTVIIFTSDNGPHREGGADPNYFDSNGPFKGFKRDLYEGGIRVPLIVHWPGHIQPSTSDHISAFWDLFPTVCDLANLESPTDLDGISMMPELKGEPQAVHEYLYWEFHDKGGKQAVRYGDWKGVRLKMSDTPDAPIELYNLAQDAAEENDVATEYPEVVDKIANIMKAEHSTSEVFRFGYETN